MNKTSWRHHYIPQFYLKGFLNENNRFAIYDKKHDRIKSGEYSTKSHFFQENRNLIEVDGVSTDILETKMYKSLDDTIGLVFKEIETLGFDFLTFENLLTLKMFISFLYWRIPTNDQLLQDTIDTNDFRSLGFELKQKFGSNNSDIEMARDRFRNDPAFRKMISVILPFGKNNTFSIEPHTGEEEMWKAIGYPKEGFYLSCDNPIITLRKDMFYGKEQKLLFPVTYSKLLYYGQTTNMKKLTPEFNIQMDLAIMHVAERYVCGPNKDYLEDIRRLYEIEKEFNSTELIIPKLFEFFDEQ